MNLQCNNHSFFLFHIDETASWQVCNETKSWFHWISWVTAVLLLSVLHSAILTPINTEPTYLMAKKQAGPDRPVVSVRISRDHTCNKFSDNSRFHLKPSPGCLDSLILCQKPWDPWDQELFFNLKGNSIILP